MAIKRNDAMGISNLVSQVGFLFRIIVKENIFLGSNNVINRSCPDIRSR